MSRQHARPRLSTGDSGLDFILGGGLPEHALILLQGGVGTGKTTSSLQFLLDGVARGETCVFFALGNSERQLEAMAAVHGWSLSGLHIRELPLEQLFASRQTLFPSHQMELVGLTDWLRASIEELQPRRIVIDAINYVRVLATSAARYRQELMAMREMFTEQRVSALVIDVDDSTVDPTLRSLSDGIISLRSTPPSYGDGRFHLIIEKMRTVRFHGGYHDFAIRTGGLVVFPRVVPNPARQRTSWSIIPSGVPGLEAMLGGGLESGTACMLIGASGVGKSTLSNVYVSEVVARGQRAAVFLFEERLEMFFHRTSGVGLDLESAADTELLEVDRIEPGTISPGEFGRRIEAAVARGAKLVVIDSLTGYLSAMAEEDVLVMQLHDLLNYLAQHDVLTIFTIEQQGLIADHLMVPLRISEVADTVMLLRFFESEGAIRKAITVMKKRSSDHEKGARELVISDRGVSVGPADPRFANLLAATLSRPAGVATGVMTDDPESE